MDKTVYTIAIPEHVGNRVEVKLFDGRPIIIEFFEDGIYVEGPNVHTIRRIANGKDRFGIPG
jgi:hypothetical protein